MKRGKMRFSKKKTKPTARLIDKKRVVTSILLTFNHILEGSTHTGRLYTYFYMHNLSTCTLDLVFSWFYVSKEWKKEFFKDGHTTKRSENKIQMANSQSLPL